MTGSAPRPRQLLRFIVVTLAWLPVAFIAWYVLAPVVLLPAELLVRGVARVFLPDLVRSVSLEAVPPDVDTPSDLEPL